jgi:cold shock CspA family protein
MNVVALVGRVGDRPFRPGGADRVVMRVVVASNRRSERADEIEVHCFAGVADSVVSGIRVGDVVEIRGRIEQRIGRDDQGEYEDLRVVADHVAVVTASSLAPPHSSAVRKEEADSRSCDGTSCADADIVEGTIKHFRSNENYGFISAPNLETDVFFVAHDIHHRIPPHRGDTVRFVLTHRERGLGALHITITTPGADERTVAP